MSQTSLKWCFIFNFSLHFSLSQVILDLQQHPEWSVPLKIVLTCHGVLHVTPEELKSLGTIWKKIRWAQITGAL